MFEHFGLRDLFVGLWKYKKIWISVGAAVFIVIVGIVSLEKKEEKRIEVSVPQEELIRYESSRVFTFTGENRSVKDLVLIYKEITASTECKQYVFDELCEMYEKKELKERLNLQSLSDEQITWEIVGQYVSYDTLGEKGAARIRVFTPDREVSDDIRDLFFKYYEESVRNSGEIKFSFLTEGANQMVHKEIRVENKYSAIKKYVILGAMGCWFLSFAGIFIYILFNPTLNRREDFSEYGIEFLGEVPIGCIKI